MFCLPPHGGQKSSLFIPNRTNLLGPYYHKHDIFSDVDLEDLLSALAPSEIQSLVDEMASDPDDKHLPASVRNSYRCSKEPTGELNRDSLINHINQEGIAGSHPCLRKFLRICSPRTAFM